mmetsp:Transcript_29860/g.46593  ORF Transcript_29860/g.46593 Transcript_29860/m.46593 type:complete len:390 (-) Transcript_29860:84-1253(-)
MAGAGLLLNVQLAMMSKLLELGWPDFSLLGAAMVLQGASVAVWLVTAPPPIPTLHECKWVLLAGVSFAGSFSLMVFAVRAGVPIGDFAALNSANVVFAAFLGRIFLKEALRSVHFMAVFSSMVGAVLISKPVVFFGHVEERDVNSAWIGYLLALGSGFCDACIYICSRKCAASSPGLVLLSFTAIGSMVMIACAPFVLESFESAVEPFLASPMEGLGWLAATYAIGVLSLLMFTLAAQWCPAAVSATVDTATRMISGYAAQVFLFGASLDPFTFGGAGLMLCSVVAMALLQPSNPSPEECVRHDDFTSCTSESEASKRSCRTDGIEVEEGDNPINEEDSESLASFVAAEFTGSLSHHMSVRFRRSTVNSSDITARTLGAISVGVVPASA